MYIFNSTNLSEPIILQIASLVIPENTPTINSITLRSKQEGATHGNWGRFYPDAYRITLCVPQFIKDFSSIRAYSKVESFYEDRYDFLAAILGHEYRHAWQHKNKKYLFHVTGWIEVDAEEYESVALSKWKKWKEENEWVTPEESHKQVATGMVRWKDYKNRNE